MIARLVYTSILIVGLFGSNSAYALKDNTFSVALFAGDAYALRNSRLSLGRFDIGVSDIADLYVGSRRWLDNYYAGFGLTSTVGVYGLVGYEWRPISWVGLTFEFNGVTSARAFTAGRFYLGIVAGW